MTARYPLAGLNLLTNGKISPGRAKTGLPTFIMRNKTRNFSTPSMLPKPLHHCRFESITNRVNYM